MKVIDAPLKIVHLMLICHLGRPSDYIKFTVLTLLSYSNQKTDIVRQRHQHAPAGQGCQARRPLRLRVDPRVLQPRRARAHEPPRLGIPAIRLQEERVNQQQPSDLRRDSQPTPRRRLQSHLVHDVGAIAVPCKEHAPDVPVPREPVLVLRPRRHPPQPR